MNNPQNLRYSEEHEWVKVEKNFGVVGITSHAQSQLGDITFVELPKVGTQVKKGQTMGVVESVKAVSDIFSPLTGTIKEINQPLAEKPETINGDPYGNGWLVKIQMTNPSELDSLLTAEQYDKLTQ